MRNRLALTTILAAAPFFGYGRNAYAACDPSPASPTFVCTGASVVTQAITANNANVSTAPGFSVIAPAGDGITITGDGHVRFTDQNASIITGDEDGLEVSATGDDGTTPGAVTVTVNSTITGGHNGIRADNYGSGDLVVTADGKVTGDNGAGILAGVGANGRNLTVNTGTQSDVTGYNFGIDARSSGSGDLIVNANGKVTATDGEGIFAFNAYGRDLTITTGADSNVTGNRFGIRGRNDGTGDLAITVNGDVTGTVREGVYAFANSAANNLTVTVAAGSVVKGGYDGVEARSLGHGALKVAVYGEVTGTVQNGVWVVNYAGTSATVITGAGSKVTGYDGIAGRNDKGDFIITANGEVTGRERHGIYARNTANGGKLKITAGATSNVTGYSNGIGARNEGSGDVEIIVEGKVTGEGRYGIEASNSANGGNLIITTTAGSDVTGELHGIRAGRNYGTGGDLIVTANGKVTGELADGIAADNRSPAVNLMIATGVASVITGYGNGINANNSGSGDLSITANGEVAGTTRSGITAFNSGNSKNLKIATGAASSITGVGDGIRATNSGIEDLDIDVGGRVVATNGYGIRAENSLGSFNLNITTGVASDVEGSFDAILARNSGRGTLAVAVDGKATGSIGNGVMAVNYATGDALTIRTGATSAVKGFNGIAAQNSGRGDLAIEIGGEVTGTNFDGIYGRNFANDAKLTITTAAGSVVSGNDDGIDARMDGTGDIEIMANGLVSGQNGIRAYNNTGGSFTITVGATGAVDGIGAGIKATSTSEPVVINNSGLITATNFLAIDAKGASAKIFNSGIVRGSVNLTAQDDTFDNLAGGVFEARGAASYFGAGIDTVNNAGLVHTASGTASIENIYFDNLEFFNNSGAISLVDGLEGDQFGMGPATKYAGTGGKLIVDAFLAPGLPGRSDLLLISGSTSGTTNLVVNLTNPVGSTPNYDGIQVVSVTGTSQAGDFKVEGGVLNAGFFAWDLRSVADVGSVIHELYTTGLGAGAYEFAAGITGAQDMWQQTTGSLLQRQADLRPAISAIQATPVADFATPVEPTPVGRVTPGLWFKGVGGWLDRDGEADNNVTLDRKQTVFGGIAGFDFGTENLAGQGDALLFGLFGGYLTSKLSFDSTNTEWTYDGPTVGIYATYLNEAFYADAVIKADFLDIDIDADDLAPDAEADTNATNIGGQIDLGYKIGFGQGAFIEPQASLSVLHTEIDDIDDIFGGSIEFEDETSVRGRLGLRLGADYQHGGLLLTPDVTASVWQSFTGDNTVTVFAPLTPASDVSDDPGETVGDVSLGLAVTAPEGWSGFLRGNYQFAEDYEAITGNAGVRYSW